VEPKNLKLRFSLEAVIHLLSEANLSRVEKVNRDTMEINVPVNFLRRGGKTHIVLPKNSEKFTLVERDEQKTQDSAVLTLKKALLEAERYEHRLTCENLFSLKELSILENKSISYVCDIYNLNRLAPDLKEKILRGNIQPGLTLQELKKRAIPLDWEEQREIWEGKR
jgi:hypothetical protein